MGRASFLMGSTRPIFFRSETNRSRPAPPPPPNGLQLRLNPLTGDSEGPAPSQHRQLLAATSYLHMLNDTARNRAYRHAINATVTDPTSRVLDIG